MMKQSIAKIREGQISVAKPSVSLNLKKFGAKFSDDEDD